MISKATFSVSTVLIRALAVILFVGYFAARYDMYVAGKHIPHHADKAPLAAVIVNVLCNPIYFYCAGLWFLAGVFGRMKRGEAFTPAILTDLKALALCLLAGGLFGTVVFPLIIWTVSALATHKPSLSLLTFHGTDLTIGLLGLVLLLVSRQGRRLRGELDQFV